jgi:DNA-binding CsgD family transcriptional regulator
VRFRGHGGSIAGIGAASSAGGADLSQPHLDRVQMLSQQFYTGFLRLERKQHGANMVALSAREREVLHWIAAGKTRDEVAIILKVSGRVVKFHMHNVQQKLNASNATIAILRAQHLGLIAV